VIATKRIYREIPFGHQACTVCHEIVENLAERRLRTTPRIRLHGPRDNRCPGSREQGKPWLEASRLPTWDELSDVDKGCALMFVWKVYWERSYRYALDNYPATYLDSSLLRELPSDVACRHDNAVALGDIERYRFLWSYLAADYRLGRDEFARLYDLALDAERAADAKGGQS
jgi:hypothetical protein